MFRRCRPTALWICTSNKRNPNCCISTKVNGLPSIVLSINEKYDIINLPGTLAGTHNWTYTFYSGIRVRPPMTSLHREDFRSCRQDTHLSTDRASIIPWRRFRVVFWVKYFYESTKQIDISQNNCSSFLRDIIHVRTLFFCAFSLHIGIHNRLAGRKDCKIKKPNYQFWKNNGSLGR